MTTTHGDPSRPWPTALQKVQAVLPAPPARRQVLLLGLGAFALGTDAFVISGVLPEIGRDLGVGLGRAGLLVTVFSASYALSAPFTAVLTGGVCRRRLLLAALVAFAAANLLAALADGYALLTVARVLAAVAAGGYMPAAAATAAAVSAPEERGRALAVVVGGLTLANAVGVPAGTLLAHASSWRATFLFVALLGAVAALGLARALGTVPSTGVPSLRQRARAGLRPGVRPALVVTALAIGGVFVLYTYLAWFGTRVAWLSPGETTALYLIFGFCAVVSNLLGGWLVDHHEPAAVGQASIGGLIAAFAGLAAVAALAPSHALATVLVGVLVATWSLVGWWFFPAQQKRLLELGGEDGPTVLSLNASALYAGQAGAAAIGAAALSSGAVAVAGTAAAVEAVALVALTVSVGSRTVAAAATASGGAAPAMTPSEW